MQIYQAGPLFSEAERSWHQSLRDRLRRLGYTVVWPGDFFSQEEVAALGERAAVTIMERDRAALEESDVVLALLDGPQVDDGTSWEIGYAYARSIPVIGIRTDFRGVSDTRFGQVNAMIQGSVACMVSTVEEAISALTTLPLPASFRETFSPQSSFSPARGRP